MIGHRPINIRLATTNDAPEIRSLLEQLGYPNRESLVKDKILKLIHHPDHALVVFEDGGVKAVMSVHFVPQVAVEGDFAIISYLSVDESVRSQGIGKQLEEYAVQMAKGRNCDRIQLHSHIRRTDAHRFYERQGYTESRKYFSKKLGDEKHSS